MPGKPFQSKLEPHFDFILEARRKRQTWQAIAQELVGRGVATTPQAIYGFAKRRLKRRYPLGMAPVETRSVTAEPALTKEPPDLPKFSPSESERAVRELTSSPSIKGPIWKPKK